MSDYTPTRTAVRNSYISRRVRYGQRAVAARAEFEAWLAEHDAEVRAEEREKAAQIVDAWRRGYAPGNEPQKKALMQAAARIREQGKEQGS